MATGLVTDIAQSEPAEFGILSPAATVTVDTSSNWSAGIDFETPNCAAQVRLNAICSAASGVTVVAPDTGAALFRRYLPFDIETEFLCSTFGFNFLDYEDKAELYMRLAQGKAIENELWTGRLAKQQTTLWGATSGHNGESFPNKWLASPETIDVTPTPGTAVKPKYGLALLEDALGDCGIGIKGVVHATRGVASALNLKASNGRLVTSLGNTVIAGVGYPGTAPNGSQPAGSAVWMYATGPVSVRLGPIQATPGNRNQSVNIANNQVDVFANRPAAVAWDSCCHYGVLVDLAADYA